MLEPVEYLLQCELHSRKNCAVAACDPVSTSGSSSKWQHSCTRGDQNRQMGNDESQAEEPANRAARDREHAAAPTRLARL